MRGLDQYITGNWGGGSIQPFDEDGIEFGTKTNLDGRGIMRPLDQVTLKGRQAYKPEGSPAYTHSMHKNEEGETILRIDDQNAIDFWLEICLPSQKRWTDLLGSWDEDCRVDGIAISRVISQEEDGCLNLKVLWTFPDYGCAMKCYEAWQAEESTEPSEEEGLR